MGDLRSVAQNGLQVRVPGYRHPRWVSPQARWEFAKDTRRLTIEPVMSSVSVLSGEDGKIRPCSVSKTEYFLSGNPSPTSTGR